MCKNLIQRFQTNFCFEDCILYIRACFEIRISCFEFKGNLFSLEKVSLLIDLDGLADKLGIDFGLIFFLKVFCNRK